MWFKVLVEVIVISVVLVLGISYYVFHTYVYPPKMLMVTTPEDLDINYENVSFQTEDDLTLQGWFVRSAERSDQAIIITHGYPANKSDVLGWGKFLQEKYNLFYFDFRAHGKSQGNTATFGYHEQKDIAAAINYLKTRDEINPNRIGVMGFSMGGVTGLLSAAQGLEIKAVVADSPYASLSAMVNEVFRGYSFLKWPFVELTRLWAKWILKFDFNEISLEQKANQISTPVLLIHAQNDPVIPSSNSQTIYDNLAGPKEIWLTDSSDHGANYYLFKEEYQTKVLDFFEQYLD